MNLNETKIYSKPWRLTSLDFNFPRLFKLGQANPLIERMIAGENKSGEDRNIPGFPLGRLYPADTGQIQQKTKYY